MTPSGERRRTRKTPDPVLPWIPTREFAAFRQACDDTFEAPCIRPIISESGKGCKTRYGEQVVLERAWGLPFHEVLQNMEPARQFHLNSLIEIFVRAGMVNLHSLAGRIINWDLARRGLDGFQFCAHDRLHHILVDRTTAAGWAEELANREKIEAAKRVPLFIQLGVMDDRIPYTILLYRGSPMDTPAILLADFSRELWGPRSPRSVADRRYMIKQALTRLRILIIVDEAETEPAACFDFWHWLHDTCGLGIILLGTERLLTKKLLTKRHEPLGTRAGPVLRLGPPKLEELKGALRKNFPDAVLDRAWARSHRRMRTFELILVELRRAVRDDPRLRPTPELVDDIAALIPCALPASKGDSESVPMGAREGAAPAMATIIGQAGRRLKAARGR